MFSLIFVLNSFRRPPVVSSWKSKVCLDSVLTSFRCPSSHPVLEVEGLFVFRVLFFSLRSSQNPEARRFVWLSCTIFLSALKSSSPESRCLVWLSFCYSSKSRRSMFCLTFVLDSFPRSHCQRSKGLPVLFTFSSWFFSLVFSHPSWK